MQIFDHTMGADRLGSIIIAVHGREAPTEEAWDKWLEYSFKCLTEGATQCLVVSFGGLPTSLQRAKSNMRFQGNEDADLRVVLMSNGRFAQTVMRAFAAMGIVKIDVTKIDDYDKACEKFQAPPAIGLQLKAKVSTLENELDRLTTSKSA